MEGKNRRKIIEKRKKNKTKERKEKKTGLGKRENVSSMRLGEVSFV